MVQSCPFASILVKKSPTMMDLDATRYVERVVGVGLAESVACLSSFLS